MIRRVAGLKTLAPYVSRDIGTIHGLNWWNACGLGCAGMPATPKSNANPRRGSLTRCDTKNPRLPRSAFPCSTSFSGRVPIHRSFQTILSGGVKMWRETCAPNAPIIALKSAVRPELAS